VGKGGGGKGWRRERLEEEKGGKEKGTAGWGREDGEGLCILKISLESPGPRPFLTLRLIDAPVQHSSRIRFLRLFQNPKKFDFTFF